MAAAAAAVALPRPSHAQAAPFARALAYSAEHGGTTLVILRNGVVWAEDFRDGAAPHTPRPIGEATASFLPALAGALVRDRVISLDEPASMTLGDWGAHPVKSRIVLRQLLDQTCGLAAGRPLGAFEACALEPVSEPGQRFIRDDAPIRIFVEIARRKLAAASRTADPAGYVTERVLSPVGCAPVAWRRERDGEASFTDGATVAPRAWARWGELMRRVGVWRASRLVDGEALREACRGSWVQPRYGFGLWLAWPANTAAPLYPESDLWTAAPPADLVMAASAKGDRLFILPTQRLVVVRQAARRAGYSDAAFLSHLLTEA
jgi:CubicO group peptidase (beta-lactamase class C family)